MTDSSTLPHLEPGVFGPDDPDGLLAFFRANGFAILRGIFDEPTMAAMEVQCVDAQARVVSGELDPKHGTTILVDDADTGRASQFANYVLYIERLSPVVKDCIDHPVLMALMRGLLGDDCWADENERFGVVYQDARPGRESSYTRIGWHSDWQSGPNLRVWPSVAFTFHIDGTSPDNGFLRVVPGSHLWATPAPYENVNGARVPEGSAAAAGHTAEPPPFPMPLRFEKVPGEIGVYAERGDIILHDAYLWHSAARATADETTRRHVRGGFYGGERMSASHYDEFVKNAAR
ncbi:MAG: phytanoyl-CoA dioxygenase (PhyH) protein [Ilumatobacteraceae bacterium]|nr:phytanoyl-CoA dioxygenase (PhyH) protein [Ilumatobacteraceae bacterium]